MNEEILRDLEDLNRALPVDVLDSDSEEKKAEAQRVQAERLRVEDELKAIADQLQNIDSIEMPEILKKSDSKSIYHGIIDKQIAQLATLDSLVPKLELKQPEMKARLEQYKIGMASVRTEDAQELLEKINKLQKEIENMEQVIKAAPQIEKKAKQDIKENQKSLDNLDKLIASDFEDYKAMVAEKLIEKQEQALEIQKVLTIQENFVEPNISVLFANAITDYDNGTINEETLNQRLIQIKEAIGPKKLELIEENRKNKLLEVAELRKGSEARLSFANGVSETTASDKYVDQYRVKSYQKAIDGKNTEISGLEQTVVTNNKEIAINNELKGLFITDLENEKNKLTALERNYKNKAKPKKGKKNKPSAELVVARNKVAEIKGFINQLDTENGILYQDNFFNNSYVALLEDERISLQEDKDKLQAEISNTINEENLNRKNYLEKENGNLNMLTTLEQAAQISFVDKLDNLIAKTTTKQVVKEEDKKIIPLPLLAGVALTAEEQETYDKITQDAIALGTGAAVVAAAGLTAADLGRKEVITTKTASEKLITKVKENKKKIFGYALAAAMLIALILSPICCDRQTPTPTPPYTPPVEVVVPAEPTAVATSTPSYVEVNENTNEAVITTITPTTTIAQVITGGGETVIPVDDGTVITDDNPDDDNPNDDNPDDDNPDDDNPDDDNPDDDNPDDDNPDDDNPDDDEPEEEITVDYDLAKATPEGTGDSAPADGHVAFIEGESIEVAKADGSRVINSVNKDGQNQTITVAPNGATTVEIGTGTVTSLDSDTNRLTNPDFTPAEIKAPPTASEIALVPSTGVAPITVEEAKTTMTSQEEQNFEAGAADLFADFDSQQTQDASEARSR